MFSLGKNTVDLRALRRKVPLKALSHVQPIVLLQMVVGLSQALNGNAAQPEAAARALILDGQQRLRRLRAAAPDLDLSLGGLLRKICANETPEAHLSEEASAVQAMLEMCLGLMLRWLSKRDDQSFTPPPDVGVGLLSFAEFLLLPHISSPDHLFRARSCPISQQ